MEIGNLTVTKMKEELLTGYTDLKMKKSLENFIDEFESFIRIYIYF